MPEIANFRGNVENCRVTISANCKVFWISNYFCNIFCVKQNNVSILKAFLNFLYKVSPERPVFRAPGTNGNVKQCEPEHFVWLSPDTTSSCREREFPDISTNLRGLWASGADCIEIPILLDKRTSIQKVLHNSQCTFILRSLSADNNKCHSHFPH